MPGKQTVRPTSSLFKRTDPPPSSQNAELASKQPTNAANQQDISTADWRRDEQSNELAGKRLTFQEVTVHLDMDDLVLLVEVQVDVRLTVHPGDRQGSRSIALPT